MNAHQTTHARERQAGVWVCGNRNKKEKKKVCPCHWKARDLPKRAGAQMEESRLCSKSFNELRELSAGINSSIEIWKDR